jgi:hypothetical protein
MATTRANDLPKADQIGATGTDDTSRVAAVGGAVADAAETVRNAAGDAAARLPDVAATTRSAIEDANRHMRAGSDEMLAIGTVLSFGFAMGLLIGGAARVLVAAALIPAAMMGLTMLDRSSRTRTGAKRLQGG